MPSLSCCSVAALPRGTIPGMDRSSGASPAQVILALVIVAAVVLVVVIALRRVGQ